MRYTLTLLCFTLTATGLGQTTVYDFLRLDRSARIAALGGNSVSLAGDIASFFQNPAVLDSSTHKQASFSFQKHVLDINSGFVAYGRTLPGIGQFGAGISVVSYGNFEETDAVGNTTGSFSAGDFALQIGYAVQPSTLWLWGVACRGSTEIHLFQHSGIPLYGSGSRRGPFACCAQ
ncbi:MAG: hypothetical protein RML35_10865 [Chloroherpetonaceae bacterium]|nr:hypothetical protein [Chloroherpetonaceae bacterium]